MNELANQWVTENVRPDKDTWLARQAFEAGYQAANAEINRLRDTLITIRDQQHDNSRTIPSMPTKN